MMAGNSDILALRFSEYWAQGKAIAVTQWVPVFPVRYEHYIHVKK
jgi:hypothetical protein